MKDGKGVITDKTSDEDKIELTLWDGQDNRLTIKGLPIDTYTVIETNAEGLITGYELQATSRTGSSAATTRDGTSTVVLKNNYEKITASLVIEKSWTITDAQGNSVAESELANQLAALAFHVVGSGLTNDETYDETFYYAQFENGKLTIEGLTPGTYTVAETNADGLIANYTLTASTNSGPATIEKDGTGTVQLSNTYKQDKGSLKITKTVEGAPESAKEKEFTITVRNGAGKYIRADGTESDSKVELKVQSGTPVTINNLPVGRYMVSELINSTEIANYTLNASSVTEGEVQITAGGEAGVELVNTYDQDKGSIKVTKLAIGAPDGTPFQIAVKNTDGKFMTQKGSVSDSEAWVTLKSSESAEWTGLPVGAYTVEEVDAKIEGLTLTVTGTGNVEVAKDAQTDVTVVNNYTDDLGKLTITKAFTGLPKEADTAHLRFDIEGTLADGSKVNYTVYYIQFSGGSFTLENLPVGEYTVTESLDSAVIEAYTLIAVNDTAVDALNGENAITVKIEKGGEGKADFTNEYEQDIGDLVIIKTFEGTDKLTEEELKQLDNLAFEVTGPNSFSLEFTYADFETEDDGTRSYKITDKPVGTYSVSEIGAEGLIAHYVLSASSVTSASTDIVKNQTVEIKLTNKYEPNLGKLQIRKVFSGQPKDADVSALEFKVTGPENYSRTVHYSDFTDGAFTIEDLPEGTYTVTETNAGDLVANYNLMAISVTEGDANVVANKTATVKLINLYEPKLGNLTISKTWSGQPDDAVLDGLSFRITGPDGYEQIVSYAAFEGGSYTINKLKVGRYTVTETNADKLIANYTLVTDNSQTTVDADVEEGQTAVAALTNTYEPDYGMLKIVKTFTGLNHSDNVDDLEFCVFGPNGFEQTVTYGEFKNGEYTFEKLVPGEYVVYETNAAFLRFNLILKNSSVTAANAKIEKGKTTTVELKNDYDNANTDLYIMKLWEDMDNLDGSRPESVTVALYSGDKQIDTVTLNDGNDWIAMVTVPLTDSNGNAAVYTWSEVSVTGYVLTSQKTLGNITRITNSHEPELTNLTVTKVWDDNNNSGKLRPTTLKVTLSNGVSKTDYYLSENNNWTITVSDLPVYRNGEKINYTWSEQTVLGYKLQSVVTKGGVTVFTNRYRRGGGGNPPITIEDNETPLAIQVSTNHVGDCFD